MPEDTTTISAEGTGEPGSNGAPGGGSEGLVPAANTPEPATTQADGKQFTQADLDKHAGRRAAEAKRAAEKAIADQLGVTIAEAQQIIADRKAAAEAEKTEIQRAQERAAAAEAAMAQAEAARAAADRRGTIKEKLLLIGVGAQFDATDPEQLARKQKVLDAAQAIVERFAPADAVGDDLDEVIRENVLLVPGFIKDLTKPEPTPAPSGVTSGAQPPTGGHKAATYADRGRARAEAVKATQTPSDPFAFLRS